jgi:hypothetical protein
MNAAQIVLTVFTLVTCAILALVARMAHLEREEPAFYRMPRVVWHFVGWFISGPAIAALWVIAR